MLVSTTTASYRMSDTMSISVENRPHFQAFFHKYAVHFVRQKNRPPTFYGLCSVNSLFFTLCARHVLRRKSKVHCAPFKSSAASTPNSFAIAIKFVVPGAAVPFSHLETACRLTPAPHAFLHRAGVLDRRSDWQSGSLPRLHVPARRKAPPAPRPYR